MWSDPTVSAKTIRNTHLALQGVIEYVQKIEREFILAEANQQTEFKTDMLIVTSVGNDPMNQQ